MRSKEPQEPSIGADPFRHKEKKKDWDSSMEKDRRRKQETKAKKKRERPLMAQTEKASGNQDREEE